MDECYLSELLELHKTHSHKSEIPRHLFDGYLLAKSSTYSMVRETFGKTSYKFDECDGRFSLNYRVAPLLYLEQIHTSKKVPYINTEKTYEDLIESDSDFRILKNFWEFNAYFHFSILHEQGHCIAEEEFSDFPFYTKSMLGEALANTVECLCLRDLPGDGLDEFVAMNAFYKKFDHREEVYQFQELSKEADYRSLLCSLFVRFYWLHQANKELSLQHASYFSKDLPESLNNFLDLHIRVRPEFREVSGGQYFMNIKNNEQPKALHETQLCELANHILNRLQQVE